jgi:Glycosyltransferase
MKDCLVLLTKTYPYDKGEEFIENEVPVLAKSFDKVILIATSVGESPVQTRRVPENVSVFPVPASLILHSVPFAAARLFPFRNFKGCCDAEEREQIGQSLKRRLFLAYFMAKSELVCRESIKILEGCELEQCHSVTFYSYWFYDTALAAIRLKAWCKNSRKSAVSRAHGYDLYPHRNSMNYLPLRGYMLNRLDGLYPCSEDGSDYLREQYPEYRDKIRTAYLGTNDFGVSEPKPGGPFRIVSCCHIVPVKRVELLAQALACLKDSGLNLKWTHFGGGEGLDSLTGYAKESLGFMECRFAGEVKNSELMDYYRKNPVDLFVNTSSSEGLPVSIMEAISFGIPAIATNVGGTGEIVRDGETGTLVRADITPKELAEKIRSAALLPGEETDRLRQNCRLLWEKEFCAERNFEKFASAIRAK